MRMPRCRAARLLATALLIAALTTNASS
ncbi:MAG: hypothetical protein QOG37_2647, partial [Mycobacterium sp.]|nr:hypothetical protein [Mycobacterium sp.]